MSRSASTGGPVLVVGGTGRTGRRVVERLVAQGRPVRVLSRRPRGGLAGAEMLTGSITDPTTLGVAARGVHSVVVAVESDSSGSGPASPDRVHRDGLARVLEAAPRAHVVLVSQIYVTRPDAHPAAEQVIRARARAEALLRGSGTPYTVVRPSWLTDTAPAGGVRLEQGDTGEGTVSRDLVAQAVTEALVHRAVGVTFEVYDDAAADEPDWPWLLAALRPDQPNI